MLIALTTILTRIFTALAEDFLAAAPRLLAGLIFIILAGILVKLLMVVIRTGLKRALAGETPVYQQFVATIIAIFLWFGVILSFLSIVGLPALAASLGTASGFLALGIAYALSGMIADVVAGIYLLRDPDFMPGDTVTVGDMTGTVKTIELRKTRFHVDEDTVVRSNADIEKRWTKQSPE